MDNTMQRRENERKQEEKFRKKTRRVGWNGTKGKGKRGRGKLKERRKREKSEKGRRLDDENRKKRGKRG